MLANKCRSIGKVRRTIDASALPPRVTPMDVINNDFEGRMYFSKFKDDVLKTLHIHYDRAMRMLDEAKAMEPEAQAWEIVQRQRRAGLTSSFEIVCKAMHSLETSICESADLSLFMRKM